MRVRQALKRVVLIALAVLILLALGGPFLPLDFLSPEIAGALAHALGRRVEINGVSLTLFPAPALALSGVTIHEDSRSGIEPFTYAENVDAQVNLLGLVGGRRKFSRLRFTDASFNLVRTADASGGTGGRWNFQYLLDSMATADAPSVQIRAGRLNIKFGQTKSVLYFSDADLDISVGGNGAIDLRFSGVPARTDRQAESFGHFFLNGAVTSSAAGRQTNMQLELEPSSLDGMARLLGATGYNLQGQVALNAQIKGLTENLDIKGEAEFDDSRSTSILPQFGGTAKLGFNGVLDAAHQTLLIASVPSPAQPFSVNVEACNFLAVPSWSAKVEMNEAPLAAIYGAARQIGVELPDKIVVSGTVSGNIAASSSVPVAGQLMLSEPALSLAEASAMKAETASVRIAGGVITLAPAAIAVGDREAAILEATYKPGADGEADVKITTRGLTVAATRGLNLGSVPLPGQVPEGTWRGTARFRHLSSGENVWSGEYQLLNALVTVDGLAEPVRIVTATVSANAEHTVVSRIRATAGEVAFSGDYRWEPKAPRPHQFRVRVSEANAVEIERLFKPTLERGGGFLERTLSLGSAPPPPPWLTGRHAEGTFSVGALSVDGHSVSVETARAVWDGSSVKITELKGRVDDAPVRGLITVDLTGRTPTYHMEGQIEGIPCREGEVAMEGAVDASGTGVKLLSSLRAQGTLEGRSIDFSPEAEFRSVSGKFEAHGTAGPLRWKFTGLEATLAGDTYTGTGASQSDGRIVLDLTSRGRQVRYTGSLLAAKAE